MQSVKKKLPTQKFLSREITFQSKGEINISSDEQKLVRFNAVRNVKEAFQEENSLVQKLESTQRKEEDQRGIREGKIKHHTFFS